MKTTLKVRYQGSLRTEAAHLKSGNTLITDAPTDNNGKGEVFSPTDLLCVSLVACQMTIMGIVAERENIDLRGLQAEIQKVMASNPRRVAEIHITYHNPEDGLALSEVQAQKLRNAAMNCPVALSLQPEIVQEVPFSF